MKTISLRQFRDSIASLEEPVQVNRRDPDGAFVTLGSWYPVQAGVPVMVGEVTQPRFNTRPFSPAPKGGKSR